MVGDFADCDGASGMEFCCMFVSMYRGWLQREAAAGAEITCSVDGGYGLLHNSGERSHRSEVQTVESTES